MIKDILISVGAMIVIAPPILLLFNDGYIVINLIGLAYFVILFLLTKFTGCGRKAFINMYRSSMRISNMIFSNENKTKNKN